MKLSEWIKANNIPNNRILKVLEYYESIDPREKELKEYGWRFKKRDEKGKKREETPIIKTNEQKPLVDIFDDE